jgi:hypothetical protein
MKLKANNMGALLLGQSLVVLLMLCGSTCLASAQLPTKDQCPISIKDRITAYKFLAYLAYHEAQIHKYDVASRAARNLEFTWDHSYACLQTLGVSHEEITKIDGMMDTFVIPVAVLSDSGDQPDDLTNITAAYLKYMKELDGL